jgi:hypothetical protein
MGKRNWIVAMQPRPTPDGHDRLVRALRVIAKSAPSPALMSRGTGCVRGLDDPADDRMDMPQTGRAPAKEDER